MATFNAEVEGGELILKNKAGDHVVIPKYYRNEVLSMIKAKDNEAIDFVVSTLPTMNDYAEDGTVIPEGDPSKNVDKDSVEYRNALEQERINAEKNFTFLEAKEAYYNMHKDVNPKISTGKDSFIIKDIENGKPGIRNTTIVDKNVLENMSKAAAKEGVPLIDMLAIGLRESGLGYAQTKMNYIEGRPDEVFPKDVMQAWSSSFLEGLPLAYDRWLIKNNRYNKENLQKTTNGYVLKYTDPHYESPKEQEDYAKYIKSFKIDETLKEPFRKEARFLKINSGQKYNPLEEDREAKIEREKKVLMNNKDLYNFADSVYRSHIVNQQVNKE